MKNLIMSLMAGCVIALFFSPCQLMASESVASPQIQIAAAASDARVAYRYHQHRRGCYYVKKCVRVNRLGKCVKFRWILKCGPRKRI